MIVGDIRRFAVEFDLDANRIDDPTDAEWLFGRLRWWCGEVAVGRFEFDTTLRDLENEAQRVRRYEDQRQNLHLMSIPAQEAAQTVIDALFVDHGQSEDELVSDEAKYRRYIVRPMVEEFDAWDIFLFENERTGRLVWRPGDQEEFHEVHLNAGEVDRVLGEFVNELRRASTPASNDRRL